GRFMMYLVGKSNLEEGAACDGAEAHARGGGAVAEELELVHLGEHRVGGEERPLLRRGQTEDARRVGMVRVIACELRDEPSGVDEQRSRRRALAWQAAPPRARARS